jgi:lysozyme
MTILAHAAPLVKKFEGCRLKAYKCPAGVWTIGYGHTGPDVFEGRIWTQAQADAALDKDMQHALDGIRKAITSTLTDKQMAALVSFVFNLGIGAFKSSTLLKRINAHDLAGALREFPKWTHAGGKHLEGLAKRRTAEAALFREAV